MREITVKHTNQGFVVYVGKVNQDGKYVTLKLDEAEAAVLAERLKAALYH